MPYDILVVDDEQDIRELIAGILKDEGYETRTAHDSDSALAEISDRRPALIFLDIWLQGSKLDGLQLLSIIREQHPMMPVVIISGHGNIETAVSAIKNGAYDYIEKPFKVDRLVVIAERALEASSLRKQVEELEKRMPDMPELIGNSPAVQQLRDTIKKVSVGNSRIMIVGPPGAGTEVVARSIHENSSRNQGPFVVVNVATINLQNMEAEIFGMEPDDTNNPASGKIGAMEEAHNGTLFLDEVGELSIECQKRMLRVMLNQKFERVKGTKEINVDVRIVSSTSVDLQDKIDKGMFLEDLLHRLAVVPIAVPDLAQRIEDIPELINAFMKQIERQSGIKACPIGNDAMMVLQSHKWDGNLTQLRNNVERIMLLVNTQEDGIVRADQLPADLSEMMPINSQHENGNILALPLREAREQFEKDYIAAQVNRFNGNISKTAEFIGMERTSLHRKLKTLDL